MSRHARCPQEVPKIHRLAWWSQSASPRSSAESKTGQIAAGSFLEPNESQQSGSGALITDLPKKESPTPPGDCSTRATAGRKTPRLRNRFLRQTAARSLAHTGEREMRTALSTRRGRRRLAEDVSDGEAGIVT